MRNTLSRFINHVATELVVGALILVSIALLVLEEGYPEGHPARMLLSALGDAITILFIIELTVRWYVEKSTRDFFRQYWIDVIAVVPAVRALRVLRVLRLLRLVRLGILISRRLRRVLSVLHEGMAENLVVFVVLFTVFLLGAVGMTLLERDNPDFATFEQSAWWSLFTLMAGEPIGGEARSVAGRLLSVVVMLGGFTVFAMFTGVVSAYMVTRLRGGLEAKAMELEDLKNHTLICGWNRSAPVIIRELQSDPQTRDRAIVILAELADEPELSPPAPNPDLVLFFRGDYTATDVLQAARVDRANTAILLADKSKNRSDQDRDARTILAALIIEKLNPGIFTAAELLRRDNETHLRMARVEEVVVADEYAANLLAHSARASGLVEMIDELLTSARGNEFYKLPVPGFLADKTVFEATCLLKEKHDVLLVGLETAGEGGARFITNPPRDRVIGARDILVLIAEEEPEL